jgi:hypothetical protein
MSSHKVHAVSQLMFCNRFDYYWNEWNYDSNCNISGNEY